MRKKLIKNSETLRPKAYIFSTVNLEIFARTLFTAPAKFRENKPSRNGKITLSFIDIGKSCLSREFFTSLIYLLMLFAKIKLSRQFGNLLPRSGKKFLENEKFSRSGNYIFSQRNLKKNEKSHGKVREFQNFPKKDAS